MCMLTMHKQTYVSPYTDKLCYVLTTIGYIVMQNPQLHDLCMICL